MSELMNHAKLQFLPETLRQIVCDNLDKNDLAHRQEHVLAVVNYAVELSSRFSLSPRYKKILYTAAFMHDIACWEGREFHHLTGGFRAANLLLDHPGHELTAPDIQMVQTCIFEHRASFKGERKLILSDLLRLADMGKLDCEHFGMRAIYHRYGQMSRHAAVEEATQHLLEKFGPEGYGWKSYPEVGFRLYRDSIVRIKQLCTHHNKLYNYLDGCYQQIEENAVEV